eukprot:gene8312-11246_t
MTAFCENLFEFFRQFKVLAWKNSILKRRQIVILLIELIIPTLIVIGLGGLRKLSGKGYSKQVIPADIAQTTTSFQSMYVPSSDCGTDYNLVWKCDSSCNITNNVNSTYSYRNYTGCASVQIAVAPHVSTDTASKQAALQFISYMNNASIGAQNYSTFTFWSSEDKVLSYLKEVDYTLRTTVSAVVIFNSGYPTWEYTIRMNRTLNEDSGLPNPPTFGPNLDISVKTGAQKPNSIGTPYSEAYLKSGYIVLTDLVNSYIASETCLRSGKCSSNSDSITIAAEGVVRFPSARSLVNGFWSLVGSTFALLMILALLYPLANVIRSLVQEKESKLREGMSMMAMRGDALWLSWIFHFLCLFLPLSIILTIAGSSLFTYSNGTYIFFYFFVFFISSTSYCILVSTFFNRSLSAAIIGCVFFLGGYFITIGVINPTRSQILVSCLHPAACFAYGTLAFSEYEDAQIGITANTWNVSNENPVTFQDVLNMMFIDTIWMGFLAWYIAQIWPSEFGTHKPWYFLFLPSYWFSTFSYILSPLTGTTVAIHSKDHQDDSNSNVPVEPVTENLAAQIGAKTCVDIQNLYKEFNTATGKKVAVDGLNLTMYSGQITALLGHNGAGKTTAISVLTGLIPPDGGTAIIEGLDVRKDLSSIRQNLGVCPQHDILFPLLTVEEHLTMFAAFKGVKGAALKQEVETMIKSVGLTEKRNVYSQFLSGGQKRKLSVGIAFIGGSRVVFLDEPTSGMDPYSRRFTWNVIRQHREGRVIILTTHFMDEADLLGDRIAIMGDGKLLCCGSSLFLKKNYGVGYNMTIEKLNATNFDSQSVVSAIHGFVPEAVVLTDVGTELSIQLPLGSSNKFQVLFEYIDQNLENLGVRSYGMSVTTLEEVFIKVAEGTNTIATADKGRGQTSAELFDNSTDKKGLVETRSPSAEHLEKGQYAPVATFRKIDQDNQLLMFFRHVVTMLRKRALYFLRDTKSWVFVFIVPVLIFLIGLIIMKSTSYIEKQPLKSLTARGLYNTKINNNYLPTVYNTEAYFCPFNTSGDCFSTVNTAQIVGNISSVANFPLEPSANAFTIKDVSQAIFNNRKQYAASQIGAYSFVSIDRFDGANPNTSTIKSLSYLIHSNYSAIHGAPLYQLLLAQGLVRSIEPSVTVDANINPLPYTFREKARLLSFNASLATTFLGIAIPWILGAFAIFIIREREIRAKQLQMVSGVSIPAYWISSWIFDFFTIQPTIWAFVILINLFPNTKNYTQVSNGAMGSYIGLLILFAASSAPFTYVFSLLFSSPSMGQIIVQFSTLLFGLIFGIVAIVLRAIEQTTNPFLHGIRYVMCLLPPFALIDGMQNLALIETWGFSELKGSATYKPSDWNITGLPMAFMAWETIAYLIIVILIEYLGAFSWQFGTSNELPPVDATVKDADVLAEEERVRSGGADTSNILVQDIKKIYPGGKYAVKGVSLGIPNGECFGLLGINGAGKSTTLGILSGDILPSAGQARLAGLDLLTDIHRCRRQIGFCPQFDAIFELLTGREHLEMYARIKGIYEDDIPAVVNGKIAEMGLTEYAGRAAGTYSGGNKRKLSVAIAMIGEPSIVFLDEPSTGMDPVARRFMWDVISDIVTKREKCSIILTTHSMEECEALCTRIGIMVGGVLRCLGSSQHLRTHYGHGYQMEIGMILPDGSKIIPKVQEILSLLNLPPLNNDDDDVTLTKQQLIKIFQLGGNERWELELSPTGTANDLFASIESIGAVSVKHIASWWILEISYESICSFLNKTFGSYVLRERQTSKLRVEISAYENGTRRKLSSLFASIEEEKVRLNIQEYSIAQTSLEQIFNQFASQQEEETGHAAGISSVRDNRTLSTGPLPLAEVIQPKENGKVLEFES